MNRQKERIKQLLVQDNTEDLQAFLHTFYELHETRTDYTGELRRCSLVLESQLDVLEFEEKGSISSTVNALCAAYDFAAFTEGFQKGATLILSLLSNV